MSSRRCAAGPAAVAIWIADRGPTRIELGLYPVESGCGACAALRDAAVFDLRGSPVSASPILLDAVLMVLVGSRPSPRLVAIAFLRRAMRQHHDSRAYPRSSLHHRRSGGPRAVCRSPSPGSAERLHRALSSAFDPAWTCDSAHSLDVLSSHPRRDLDESGAPPRFTACPRSRRTRGHITSGMNVVSAHVVLAESADPAGAAPERLLAATRHGHSTFQSMRHEQLSGKTPTRAQH